MSSISWPNLTKNIQICVFAWFNVSPPTKEKKRHVCFLSLYIARCRMNCTLSILRLLRQRIARCTLSYSETAIPNKNWFLRTRKLPAVNAGTSLVGLCAASKAPNTFILFWASDSVRHSKAVFLLKSLLQQMENVVFEMIVLEQTVPSAATVASSKTLRYHDILLVELRRSRASVKVASTWLSALRLQTSVTGP